MLDTPPLKTFDMTVLARRAGTFRYHASEKIYMAQPVATSEHQARRIVLEDTWRLGGLVSCFLSVIDRTPT